MKSESIKKNLLNDHQKKVKVGVLGAGVGGTAAALELARRGFVVYSFDKNGEILLGSSDRNPGRAGHGFHYLHPETGILYLDATLEVVKAFPGCLIGNGESEDHYLRHGLYFIMKEDKDLKEEDKPFATLFSVEKILQTYEKLRQAYKDRIEHDFELRLFGDSEQFYRICALDKFSNIVDTSKIAAAIDTREELLNWQFLRKRLCDAINIHPNIKVYTRALVKKTHYDSETHGFRIETEQGNFKVDCVVNATWENVEYLSHQMGFYLPPDSRTLRLKCIVKVILPSTLKQQSSMFFCMGAHCMFSNMGDGTGMITYAPVTNIFNTTELQLNAEAQSFLDGEASQEKKSDFGKKIVEGVTQYIPEMRNAKIMDVGFGVIKTIGEVDIFDPASSFHHRDYLGVKVQQIRWIDLSCMKLLYFLKDAELSATMLEKHLLASQEIMKIKDRLMPSPEVMPKNKDIAEMIIVNLERNFDPDDILKNFDTIGNALFSVFERRSRINKEIKRSRRSSILILSNALSLWDKASLPNKFLFMMGMGILGYSIFLGRNSLLSENNFSFFWNAENSDHFFLSTNPAFFNFGKI